MRIPIPDADGEGAAVQLKLAEFMRASGGVYNALLDTGTLDWPEQPREGS